MVSNRLEQLRELREKRPDDPFIPYAIGLEFVKQSNDNEALKYFDQVLDRFPDYLAVYYHSGKLYERLGQPEKAVERYGAGIQLATRQGDHHSLSELKGAMAQLSDPVDPYDETFDD